jgi:hypothetical protein
VQPPGPALKVCVSSMISSVPDRRVSSRRASWNPGSGRTMPMFVRAGSARTQATSPGANARSSAPASFHWTTFVVSAGSTGGPTFPFLATTRSPSSVAKVSSTVPW